MAEGRRKKSLLWPRRYGYFLELHFVIYFLDALIYSLCSVSSSTHITLQCDPDEEGKLESLQDPLSAPVVDHLRVVSSGKFILKNYITVMLIFNNFLKCQ